MRLFDKDHNDYKTVYHDGKVSVVDKCGETIENHTIGRVEVSMETKPNEIGIRFIIQCAVFDAAQNLICNNNELIAEYEFNYSNGNADDEVIDYISSRLSIKRENISIL